MSSSKTVLVTGITGQQGGAAAKALLESGHSLRGMTRNPVSEKASKLSQSGVEMVKGDFTSKESLQDALKGVDAVFAVSTPFEQGTDGEAEQGIAIVEAAAAVGVEHLVYTSVGSADQNTGIPHFESKYQVEKFIKETGMNATIVAPVFFMDNLIGPWYAPSLKEGKLTHALPEDRMLQLISVESIGGVVAEIIARGELEYGNRYDLAEDELNGREAAAILAKITGREIAYAGFSPSLLKEQNEDFAKMYEWFDSVGYSVQCTDLQLHFPQVSWTDFRRWAKKQNWEMKELAGTS
jgi:uncharacterized protein YbjT (DUF2867 family)